MASAKAAGKFPKVDLNLPTSTTSSSTEHLPLGFVRQLGGKDPAAEVTFKINEQQLLQLKNKRAMDMGLAPGKALFMTAFMMWMAGAGVHIFSIMIVGMGVFTPIKAITQTQAHFAPAASEGVDLTVPKLAYVALNLVGLGVALYKCSTMGLLPLSSADWVGLLEPKHFVEHSV